MLRNLAVALACLATAKLGLLLALEHTNAPAVLGRERGTSAAGASPVGERREERGRAPHDGG